MSGAQIVAFPNSRRQDYDKPARPRGTRCSFTYLEPRDLSPAACDRLTADIARMLAEDHPDLPMECL